MRLIITNFLGIIFQLAAFSQSSSMIIGKVLDKDGKGISAASVSLLKGSDSSLIKMAITDKEGKYSYESVKEGKYLVVASSIGYGKRYSSIITVGHDNIE
jgi:hypothetical protein